MKKNDFDSIEDIYNTAKADELSFENESFKVLPLSKDVLRLRRFQDGGTVVCEMKGEIAGFLSHTKGYLSFLFVSRGFRRRGVAQALLNHFLKNEYDKVYLSVVSSNLPALNFYVKNGFSTEKKSVVEYNGQEVGVDIMLYPLC